MIAGLKVVVDVAVVDVVFIVVVVVGLVYVGFVGLVGNIVVVVGIWVVDVWLWYGEDEVVINVVGLPVLGEIGVVLGWPVNKRKSTNI